MSSTTSSVRKVRSKKRDDNVTSKGNQKMVTSTSSTISAKIEHLKREINELDAEIRHDREGTRSYDGDVQLLLNEKAQHMRKIAENKKYMEEFKNDIGPMEDKYNSAVEEINRLHKEAKRSHREAMKFLVEKMNYNPAFKRWNDEL
eukprot:TRINITY_DN2632_c0_g1_i2.p1 TRINITY_DN2632_c0_g1~~TRINITY_DN2632_c0_g1_i2.p1  ORF type:complete len:146 (-),score=18.75 TRINITY_DN2632_c0_g1_i2:57-494(-)